MTASSCAGSSRRRRPRAASSFRTPPRKSRWKARSSPSVKAGDKVLFGKWSGTEVKLDGVELLIMKESDIMGIIG
jgi:co-chaperonin GroES (HSP10)